MNEEMGARPWLARTQHDYARVLLDRDGSDDRSRALGLLEEARDGIIGSLAPEGHLETVLAERVASLMWRIKRVTRYEVAVVEEHVGKVEYDHTVAAGYLYGIKALDEAAEGKRNDIPEPTPEELALDRERRMIPYKNDLDKIMRYEGHLHRQCTQVLHELEAMQARRLGFPAALHRLDISSPPARVPQRPALSSGTI